MTPGDVILALKIAVTAVTLLLIASLIALIVGRPKLHGQINSVFFALTLTTVLGFEVVVRFMLPDFTAGFTTEQRDALTVHLAFAIPAAIMLPAMLFTGKRKLKTLHYVLAAIFSIVWTGTFVTGVFFLPHNINQLP